jgi:Uma2 family endonuclease
MVGRAEVEYPCSDGMPLESEEHGDAMHDLLFVLRGRLDPSRYHVAGNQFFYYEEGNPRRSFGPDVYVVDGVPQHPPRAVWKLWEDPVPALVVELLSPSSVGEDLGPKRVLYERLGIREYVVFDLLRVLPRGPLLRLWRVGSEGRYEEVAGPDPYSEVVGARLRAEGAFLRVVLADGTVLPGIEETRAIARRAEAEAQRADAESRRAEVAEQQLAALRAELERLRGS